MNPGEKTECLVKLKKNNVALNKQIKFLFFYNSIVLQNTVKATQQNSGKIWFGESWLMENEMTY